MSPNHIQRKIKFGPSIWTEMRSAICADEVQSTHPVLRLLRQTDRGRAYQHLNGLKNLYSASPPRRGEGGEQVATAHKKPHPAARRGFNSGSSDVTPPFRGTDADGDNGMGILILIPRPARRRMIYATRTDYEQVRMTRDEKRKGKIGRPRYEFVTRQQIGRGDDPA